MKGLKELAAANAGGNSPDDIFSKPFPNLRTREIVKSIVESIVETNTYCKVPPDQQAAKALDVIKGARIVADTLADDTTRFYIASLLDALNRGGIAAINRLVEAVTGHDLTAEAA